MGFNSAFKGLIAACWVTKATDTHSERVIIIVFTHEQWLRERASMLRFMDIA
jgi:hypothetical protein